MQLRRVMELFPQGSLSLSTLVRLYLLVFVDLSRQHCCYVAEQKPEEPVRGLGKCLGGWCCALGEQYLMRWKTRDLG
jgi:hypothetical protein